MISLIRISNPNQAKENELFLKPVPCRENTLSPHYIFHKHKAQPQMNFYSKTKYLKIVLMLEFLSYVPSIYFQ